MLDNSFLLIESPRTPNHLCMAQIYDPSTRPQGPMGFDEILETFRESLPYAPSFRRKLVRVPLELDNPYWVEDPDFDLEFHVRHIALPKPGDWRQFCIQVARLHARPIDLSRPPWEATVIDGLDGIEGIPAGSFAIIIKVHHAAIDGVSGVDLLNAMHDGGRGRDGDGAPAPKAWKPEAVPSPWELLQRAAVHSVTRPIATLRTAASFGPPMLRTLPRSLRNRSARLRVPRTRFNQRISAHRVFDEVRCPLGDMKEIKQLVPGATINDVCLSVIGGAMRAYLAAKDELPVESLVTMIPISTRTPDQAGAGGNQVSMMRTSLHTDIADPIERLAAVHDSTKARKAAQEGVAAARLLDVAQVVPGALIGAAVRAVSTISRDGPLTSNTIVTNVPGAREPLYLHGAKLVRSTGCVPLVDGTGLFHCVSSYVDTFTFMITADRELLPDPGFYIECLQRSLDDHLAAAATATASASA